MEKWWLKAPENGWQLNTSHRLMQIPEEPKRLMKMFLEKINMLIDCGIIALEGK